MDTTVRRLIAAGMSVNIWVPPAVPSVIQTWVPSLLESAMNASLPSNAVMSLIEPCSRRDVCPHLRGTQDDVRPGSRAVAGPQVQAAVEVASRGEVDEGAARRHLPYSRPLSDDTIPYWPRSMTSVAPPEVPSVVQSPKDPLCR